MDGLGRPCWGYRCFLSALTQGLPARGSPGHPLEKDKGRVLIQPRVRSRAILIMEVAWWGHLCQQGSAFLVIATISTMDSPSFVPLHPLPVPQDLKGPQQLWARPLPDDVLQGPQQRLLLVLDAMLGAQRLHQWGNLVEVVPGHGGEKAGESVGAM